MVGCGRSTTDIQPVNNSEWPTWGNTPEGERYSGLSQINRDNVQDLEVAWIFHTGDAEPGFASSTHLTFQTTPLMIEGKLFFNTAYGKAFAIDPESGEEIWRFDAALDKNIEYGGAVASRGLTLWEDTSRDDNEMCAQRLFMGTLNGRLYALDLNTGELCQEFGAEGYVDLTKDISLSAPGNLGITSPPVIHGDLIITGSSIADFRGVEVEPGIVRAFNARTGEEVWKWDPVPQDRSLPAWQTWGGAAAIAGAGNAWAPLSIDSARDLVFVPTSAPGSSFFGGHRPGNNDYTSSVVALRASTGEVIWHQQLVHHDVWDYDTSAQPVLIDLEKDGETIPALVQATKMGFLFVFNRETGEPVFEIQERPVPQGGVLGEQLSPTQRFPVAPPPASRQQPVTPEDAWGFTFFDRGKCADLLGQHRSEGIYTPLSLEGTIMTPGFAGGINWGSGSFDPVRQRFIVNSMDLPYVVQLATQNDSPTQEIAGPGGESAHDQWIPLQGTPYKVQFKFLLSPFGVPCTAPPWGKLLSYDLGKGVIDWEVPLGTIQTLAPFSLVPNIRFGVPNIGGSIITESGLVFIGAAVDNFLRAFDIDTGEEIWKGDLPSSGQATPMTYAVNGKQYVVIAAGGHASLGTEIGDTVIAFALPIKPTL